MPARKLAPALAAGCTAVLKPAELTPLTALALARILMEAGCPDGVVNVVTTTDAPGVVGALLADPRVRKLSFTGSTPVGRVLMAQAAGNLLRLSLELGGNAPLIVCADADLDVAVEGAVAAKLRNNGQACTAANRVIVEAPVVAELTERLAARFAELPIGHGLEPGVEIGPLIDARAVAKARRVIAAGVADGARALSGARAPHEGTFLTATVLADVPATSAALREEVFAPVAPIVTVPDVEAAVALANDTPYGLAAYVFAADAERARSVATRLEVGMVGLNTGLLSDVAAPFGGVKWSGLGREGGTEGLDEYLETRYLAVADDPTDRER
jgi:succinate-semialdehyde dehydrogenase/glutarate-semialdehyde dehydrogenase